MVGSKPGWKKVDDELISKWKNDITIDEIFKKDGNRSEGGGKGKRDRVGVEERLSRRRSARLDIREKIN